LSTLVRQVRRGGRAVVFSGPATGRRSPEAVRSTPTGTGWPRSDRVGGRGPASALAASANSKAALSTNDWTFTVIISRSAGICVRTAQVYHEFIMKKQKNAINNKTTPQYLVDVGFV
jgi:hypothetical protein